MTIHDTIDKFKQQLDQWDADIARWETGAREAGAQLGDTWKQQVAEIRERSAEFQRRFREVEHATGAAAEDVKEAMDLAWNAIKMGVFAVRSEYETMVPGESSATTPADQAKETVGGGA